MFTFNKISVDVDIATYGFQTFPNGSPYWDGFRKSILLSYRFYIETAVRFESVSYSEYIDVIITRLRADSRSMHNLVKFLKNSYFQIYRNLC